MTLERSRRLINGVWQYVTAPDGGGSGGLPSGGSTGEVLTKESNADGDVGWEAGGGSQTLRYVDLGTIEGADLTDGPVLIFTPDVDEEVIAVFVTGAVPTSDGFIGIGLIPDVVPDAPVSESRPSLFASMGSDPTTVFDTPLLGRTLSAIWEIASESLYAGPLYDGSAANIARLWEPNMLYPVTDDDTLNIAAAGTLWGNTAGSEGTSGNSEPDFAGNLGGTVTDGPDLVWTDLQVPTPTDGSITARVLVATPTAP